MVHLATLEDALTNAGGIRLLGALLFSKRTSTDFPVFYMSLEFRHVLDSPQFRDVGHSWKVHIVHDEQEFDEDDFGSA